MGPSCAQLRERLAIRRRTGSARTVEAMQPIRDLINRIRRSAPVPGEGAGRAPAPGARVDTTSAGIYFTMQSETMEPALRDVDLALSEVANIRAQLAASTRFLGLAPESNLLMGILAFVVAAAQSFQVQDHVGFIAVWAGTIVACSAVAVLAAVSRARRLHGRMAGAMLGLALQKGLPFGVAAVVITWAICRFSIESAWMLPGLWQILLGLLGFSVLSNLPREIAWVAGWYFCCGTVVLALAGQAGTVSPWMMGIPFAVGQTAVAVILLRANREGSGCG